MTTREKAIGIMGPGKYRQFEEAGLVAVDPDELVVRVAAREEGFSPRQCGVVPRMILHDPAWDDSVEKARKILGFDPPETHQAGGNP